MDGFDNLTSVKGIGAKRASTLLLSVIGNMNDFRSAEQLAAYIGIVPRGSDSKAAEKKMLERLEEMVNSPEVQDQIDEKVESILNSAMK